MNWRSVLFIGGAAFVSYKIYQKINLANNINISITEFQIKGSLVDPVIKLILAVYNPTDNTAVFSNLNGHIYNNAGYVVADLSINGNYSIDPHSTVIIPLNVQTHLDLMINELANYLKNKNASYTAKGMAYIDNLSLPFVQNYNF